MLRRNLDLGEDFIANLSLAPVYHVPSAELIDTEKYTEKLMTHLCCGISFKEFLDIEAYTFAIPNGICIVNPEEYSFKFGIPADCFVNKEYRGKDTRTFDRYISDCQKLCLFPSQDVICVNEDDIPDDDDFSACYAMYKETV